MPKFKSNSGAKKRFRASASGKVKYRKMNRAHILTKREKKRKVGLRTDGYLSNKKEAATVRIMIQKRH
ncbi:MAG: 50S ribosomal protein L35 [Firmicutes bacterium]|nr:50S ribosomal protein L35 [Bacillota bacterium]MCL1953359.1 50S ribosomal protein L35 [Bacillota bacterium]